MRNPGLDLGSENPVAQEYYWDIKFEYVLHNKEWCCINVKCPEF